MSDEVLRIRMPIGIDYNWSAGPGTSAHLRGLREGKLIGHQCPSCLLVLFPPRNGVCAKCGVLLKTDEVEVSSVGTITSFCIVNVPFLGQKIKPPYVAATILLDGADIGMQHLIQGCEASDVRMGMRVKALWKPASEWGPSLENIQHFEPSGEPDAAFETYGKHL